MLRACCVARRVLVAAALGLILSITALSARAGEIVTVYTAAEPNLIPYYVRAFRAANPDLLIEFVRGGSGEIASRLQAEKNNPRADVVFGFSSIGLANLKKQGLLEPYRPAQLDELIPSMRDQSSTPSWIGINAWAGAILVNRELARTLKLPLPKSWDDLLKPVYKGHIVMPNPAASGTGLLLVMGWMDHMGEKKAWEYMDKLHQNIREYTDSGSRPGRWALSGDVAIGLSSDALLGSMMNTQTAAAVIHPDEGIPWDMEGAAIIKGTPRLKEAQKVLDYAASSAVGGIAAQNLYIPARSDIRLARAPARVRDLLWDKDVDRDAERRQAVLAEWQRRYGTVDE